MPARTPRQPRPALLAVIPTSGRQPQHLLRCLAALQYSARGVDVSPIVVVSPATPAAVNLAQRIASPGAQCIALPGPFNYARSVQAGLDRRTNEQYVLLLNDDCFLREVTDLCTLIATLRRHKLACIGPWIEQQRGTDGYLDDRTDGQLVYPRTPVLGCCALWDWQWLERVLPFDEQFGHGYGLDESDLTWRARQLGARWARDDRVVADHVNHATFGPRVIQSRLHKQNLDRWRRKYPGVHPWGGSEHWDQ